MQAGLARRMRAPLRALQTRGKKFAFKRFRGLRAFRAALHRDFAPERDPLGRCLGKLTLRVMRM
jgi:hypothetical protein